MNEERTKRFYAFLADILREDKHLTDVKEVTGFNEETYQEGVCSTCRYDVHEVYVYYKDFNDEHQQFVLSGKLSEWL